MGREYYHYLTMKRKVSDCNLPKAFSNHLKECWLKNFKSPTIAKPYCNFEDITVFWNFGYEDIISDYNYKAFDEDAELKNTYPTSYDTLGMGLSLNFYEYLDHKTNIALLMHKFPKGKQIIAVFCESSNSKNIFDVFFTDTLYEARENRKTDNSQYTQRMSDEDIIRDGFDDDMDAWNHNNQ